MVEMLFSNTQARAFHCNGVRILPGKTKVVVTENVAKAVRADGQFKLWQQQGWVKERQAQVAATPDAPPAPTTPSDEPGKKENALPNVEKSRKIIAECDDSETLLIWYETDSRQTIRNLCEKRINGLITEGAAAAAEAAEGASDQAGGASDAPTDTEASENAPAEGTEPGEG